MSDTACLCLQTYVFTKSWRFKAVNRRALQDEEVHDGHNMGEVALTDLAKPEHATNGLANGHTNGGFGMSFSQSRPPAPLQVGLPVLHVASVMHSLQGLVIVGKWFAWKLPCLLTQIM